MLPYQEAIASEFKESASLLKFLYARKDCLKVDKYQNHITKRFKMALDNFNRNGVTIPDCHKELKGSGVLLIWI
ncbi:hypothetical protein BpHYR1_021423 [Brachionus plicatilis]|uniref:Uncharacterized protein n=1 Tax=Brachionus plicatilis TaxID=10195 RepID=A0A3M7PTZ1_BRAPC|nr:hypothetical protein BpHYR1_021423 [Brachionus plicatilis]